MAVDFFIKFITTPPTLYTKVVVIVMLPIPIGDPFNQHHHTLPAHFLLYVLIENCTHVGRTTAFRVFYTNICLLYKYMCDVTLSRLNFFDTMVAVERKALIPACSRFLCSTLYNSIYVVTVHMIHCGGK